MTRRAPLYWILVALVALAGTAFADNVSTLIDELKNNDSDKVRLAAAANLGNLGDEKAILPMAGVLLNDSDKSVRAACAVGLGKLVTSKTKSSYKNLAVANLQKAAANDPSDFVKDQAQKALNKITGGSGSSSGSSSSGTSSGGSGIYVNVGPMSSKTGSNDSKLRALMAKVAQDTLAKKGPHLATTWSGGTPSKALLAQRGISGFYVDGTLNTLSVKTSGGGATISCKVSMLLADFPDKSVFGFLNGGASVTAGSSQSDQDLAGQDCVQAVIENLIANKIIPTICSKAGGTCP